MSNNDSSNFFMTDYKAQYILADLEKTVRLVNLADKILIIYSSLIVFFGTIFNALNFGCFYRMKKRNSQNIYLGALSLSEMLNIHVNILVPLLIRLADYNHFSLQTFLHSFTMSLFHKDYSAEIYDFLCILNGYLVEVCLLLPVWIMVILSTERFFCIMWPLKKNLFSTRKNAKSILGLLLLAVCMWSMFKFKTAGVETYSTFEKFPHVGSRNVTLPAFVNISTILWAIVPEFLTLILNLLIINQIKITTRMHRRFYPLEHSKKITQATRVVILLSVIFIVLISPTGVLIILDMFFNRDVSFDFHVNVKRALNFMLARKFVIMFYETNLIINFFIYLLTIKNFKETLKNLFSVRLSRLSRKDSTKIGFKTKYYISSKLIKTPSSKSKIKFESEKKPIRNYLDHNNNIFEYKMNSECSSSKNPNKKSYSSYSNSSMNENFCSIPYNSCPYCYRFRKYSQIEDQNFRSLIEFKENDKLCSINCPLKKFNSMRRSDHSYIPMLNKNDPKNQSSCKIKYSSLRKKRKFSQNTKKSSLKTSF